MRVRLASLVEKRSLRIRIVNVGQEQQLDFDGKSDVCEEVAALQ